MEDKDNIETSKISEFNDDSLRKIAKEIVIRRFALRVHWIAYICVNLLLVVINLMVQNWTFNSSLHIGGFTFVYAWCEWPLTGWGIALAIHTFSYIIYRKGLVSTTAAGLLAYHTFIYIIVILFLIYVNLVSVDLIAAVNPSAMYIWWVFWPLGCWGAALIVHWIVYLYGRPKKGEDSHKSSVDREVENELKKVKKP